MITVEAPPAHAMAGAPSAAVPKALADALLDNDEIIELSLKPSLLFIPGLSLPYLASIAVLAGAFELSSRGVHSEVRSTIFQLFGLAAVGVLVIAALHWASRVYVLTNRRVLCFAGILSVRARECALRRAAGARLDQDFWQRVFRLGSIQIASANAPAPEVCWTYVARPKDVHERVVRAIQRAHS